MDEKRNTNLLNQLIRRAKAIGSDGNAPLTAERFLVAVIDLLTESNHESDEALAPLADALRNNNIDLKAAKSVLMSYVNGGSGSGTTLMDVLYMTKKVDDAYKAAMHENAKLTALTVLNSILTDPTVAIKKCMGDIQKDTVSGVGPSADNGKTAGGSLEDMLSDLLSGVSGRFAPDSETDTDTTPQTASDCNSAKAKIREMTKEVRRVYDALSEVVFGQDNAVSTFTAGYFRSMLLSMTDKKRTKPSATFLFAGPPGVGKTFLAEKAAEVLDLPFERFDMSEYCDKEAAIEFIGSDNVYKNSKGGNFTTFVKEHPRCVLLFDEIEKAHISIIHLFLQILDAGRIRDSNSDEEISLKDTIMIFTTNAGRQLYENTDQTDFSGVSRKVILGALQNDINPATNQPYFPAAICSRFASGNVVMFNHLGAHNLCEIGKKEILRHAMNYQNETGVEITFDEKVFACVMFAEGGHADGRTIRARAESFFDSELFELFRLVGADSSQGEISAIEKIFVTVDVPDDGSDIAKLFAHETSPEMLVFADAQQVAVCENKTAGLAFFGATDIESAKKIMGERDVECILIDICLGQCGEEKQYLNIEDVDSVARDFLHFARENYPDTPVYLLQSAKHVFDGEEKVSFMRQGVRGVVDLLGTDAQVNETLHTVCNNLYFHRSMKTLAKSNRVVSFETSQRLLNDGKVAEIRLFDFALTVAMDAADSKNVLSNLSKPNVRFDDIIGASEAKAELKYFIEYLRNPKKFVGTGVKPPKGILLYGPPGTGKTMLAKALACEADVTYISAEGNQFLKKFVGEGPEAVHELFATARKYAPSILFIDEIDAIAKERTGGDNEHHAEILTAFLAEMDGFKNDISKPVFVLAATNYNVEPGTSKSLDGALLRRFDRRLYIDRPKRDDRLRFMQMKVKKNPAFVISEEKMNNLAMRSTGMSLADLESVFELALRSAIRVGEVKVTDAVLDEAFEVFTYGEKTDWDASQLERVARHEAGHALLCMCAGETPSYVTIISRGDHGGYVQHADNEGKAIYTKEELLARIRTSLAGRAAELVYYGEKDGVSTGASGDLQNATRLATHLLCSYGMDDTFGLAVIDPDNAGMSALVHEAVKNILNEQMLETVRLILDKKAVMDRMVDVLLQENQLSGERIKAIFDGLE